MSRLKFTLKLLGLACAAGLCLGATYTWTDGGDGHRWDTILNWSSIGAIGYPDDESDDATIPYLSGGWTVDLIDIDRIDDFVIGGSVEFAPADPNGVTLVAESLTIAGGESTETIVEITGAASIVVEAP